MASRLKTLLYPNSIWVTEPEADDPTDIDLFLEQENEHLRGQGQELEVPTDLGILPIRNAVVFPGTVTPLAIGRDRSKALLEKIKPNDTLIGLVTQRNPKTDKPKFADLYTVGTTATVLKVIKLPQGSVHIVVHAVGRFRIIRGISTKPYLRAKVEPLQVRVRTTKKLRALMVSVRQAASRVIELSPNVPEEAIVLLENIENPSALADFLAANLNLKIPEKQQLLEELNAEKRLEKIKLPI